MPSDSTHPAELVEQLPDPDKVSEAGRPAPASKFTGPAPDKARLLYGQILAGGQESLRQLLELVLLPGHADYKNDKPIYMLHGLVMHVGQPDQQEARRLVNQALIAQLKNTKSPKSSKAYFIRQLQLIGGAEAVPAIAAHLLDEDLCDDAAQALAFLGAGSGQALGQALPKANGHVRRCIIQALSRNKQADAVDPLIEALRQGPDETRMVAARTLAEWGEPKAVPELLKLADSAQGWTRIQATDCALRLAEQLGRTQQKERARHIYEHLRNNRSGPEEEHIKAAAEQALIQL